MSAVDAGAAPERASMRKSVAQPTIIMGIVVADTLAIILCGLLTKPQVSGLGAWIAVLLVIAVASGAAVMILQRLWSYTIPALVSTMRQTFKVAVALTITFALMTAAVVHSPLGQIAAPAWVGTWGLASLGALLLGRAGLAIVLARWKQEGRLMRRAVVVGGGRAAEEMIRQLRRSSSDDIRICGVFDDRSADRSADPVERYRRLGTFEELVGFCREQAIDLIIVTLPMTAEDRILGLLRKLWVLPIDIRISAHQSKLRLRPRAYSYIGSMPFLAVFDRPLTDWGWAIKEVEDRVIAAILIVLLAPVMLGVAIAVKTTSKGPILFRQKRHGFNNKLIEVYKFRSMFTELSDANAVKLVTKDDPRVTPLGRFIRKTSLDELPQLFNVLKGELSLVGPRPHATQAKAGNRIYDEVVDGYYARHRMKPGITGYAQIHGWRGETDTEEKLQRRVEYDIHYIDNWSLWLDLYILAVTPFSLLNTKNAY
jgi:Undecaprenyl-phosphate glucose phosphotransferase